MSVIFLPTSERHVVARPDADRRLGWTKCGKRFAWGGWGPNGHRGRVSNCQDCAA